MSYARSGAVELWYETFGLADDPPLLLIAGLGAQCLSWPDGLCEGLADRRFHVIRFDNRDVGLSTKLDHLQSSLDDAVTALGNGDAVEPPYTLSDMAGDATAVLDAVGARQAHIVGLSLGGMVAQLVAIEHPARVLSLTSIMSTTGHPDVGQPSPEALEALLAPPASSREASITRSMAQRRVWGSPGHVDEVELGEYFGRLWDRDNHPDASQRQYAALLAEDHREGELAHLCLPTLVVHGTVDPLVDPSGGQRTAAVIPDARLVMLEGMGHDLPAAFWPPIIEAVTELAVRAAA